MTDDFISGHPYTGELRAGASCQYVYSVLTGFSGEHKDICGRQAMEHANPGPSRERHLINTHPHEFKPQPLEPSLCGYAVSEEPPPVTLEEEPEPQVLRYRICGYPRQLHDWAAYDQYMAETAGKVGVGTKAHEALENMKEALGQWQPRSGATSLVRKADAAQYERAPMPDAARRGPVVTLIDAPVDPLGTLAVLGGIYTGKVARSKAEVTDEQRRDMLRDMQATVLDGPLEAIQFTFLVEGVGRDITHQIVRNRFSFFAQESLRFAVAEDWAQEVPLPPSLAALPQDHPAVGVWRKALNGAEDAYAALIGAGMPAEEARKVLPHAITTRLYWVVSLRTLLQEAGKRTCTQAQFDWRQIFAGVAKALRERGAGAGPVGEDSGGYCDAAHDADGWQYRAFADLLRPVCYQQGACTFMASFDRGCKIRSRVDLNAKVGRPSSEWHRGPLALGMVNGYPRTTDKDGNVVDYIGAIDPSEWAADPAAARTKE